MESGSWARKAGWKWKSVYMSQQSLGDAESRRAPPCHKKLLCGGKTAAQQRPCRGFLQECFPERCGRNRNAPLLQDNLTPMSLVELCHTVQPAAPGLVSVLVQEEGDAAQWQQVPAQAGTSAALAWLVWLRLWKVWKYQPASTWKKILAQLGGTTALAVASAGIEDAWPAWHPLQRRFK